MHPTVLKILIWSHIHWPITNFFGTLDTPPNIKCEPSNHKQNSNALKIIVILLYSLYYFCLRFFRIKNPSIKVVLKVTLSFTPLSPLFQWYWQKSNEILLNLSMKRWNSAFNAQGSRVIIVAVQVGAVKIYVAAVEALTREQTGDETQFNTKNWWKN